MDNDNSVGTTVSRSVSSQIEALTLPPLPPLPETTKNQDTLQAWYRGVRDIFIGAPLYLRHTSEGLAIRHGGRWQVYPRTTAGRESLWRDIMRAHLDVGGENWSARRTLELTQYLLLYAPGITLDSRRYLETRNCILDGETGELDYSYERWLKKPTLRVSSLAYDPEYTPSAAWQTWHDTMDAHQQAVRAWSVGSAVLGEHGLLMTWGRTRCGKSTLAEGLAGVLGTGARAISLSRDWGRFYTHGLQNTTYLYDPDAKGAKRQNELNYETLHMMASGDPIQMERKGAELTQSDNYGFIELIANRPPVLTFEESLVDRVRFCLYTYIQPRGDGGVLKRQILADKQAWLNYAVTCAMKLARGEITRPELDDYQAYGWWEWLKDQSSYGRMCASEGRLLSYTDYKYAYNGAGRFLITRETMEDIQAGVREIERQWGGGSLFAHDWQGYKKQLELEYYGETTKSLQQVSLAAVQPVQDDDSGDDDTPGDSGETIAEMLRGNGGGGDRDGVREGVREAREGGESAPHNAENAVFRGENKSRGARLANQNNRYRARGDPP